MKLITVSFTSLAMLAGLVMAHPVEELYENTDPSF